MHMSDALISPQVGGTLWLISGALIGYCAKKARTFMESYRMPLMGVLGAFVFAAQMINFSIPGTGSSGHLGGGLLLAALLGPHAAFLVISSVLVVQALFFADGGILALGCNMFNMGFFPAFIAYPLIFKRIASGSPGRGRIVAGSVTASVVGLQLGAFAVVTETFLSGVSELPFGTFLALMQPIHLAIGVVEGLITAAVVVFVWNTRPDILGLMKEKAGARKLSMRVLAGIFLLAALITGGALSWFASGSPDGLEWALSKTGRSEIESPAGGMHESLASAQEKTAILPDYSFPESGLDDTGRWPSVEKGTTVSGLVGGSITLLLIVFLSFVLKRRPGTLSSGSGTESKYL